MMTMETLRENFRECLRLHVGELGKTLHMVGPRTHGFETLTEMETECRELGFETRRFRMHVGRSTHGFEKGKLTDRLRDTGRFEFGLVVT